MVDRGGVSASIGQPLLDQADIMFTWWHRVRDGTLERSTFRSYMSRVRWSSPGYAELRIAGAMLSWELCGVDRTAPR